MHASSAAKAAPEKKEEESQAVEPTEQKQLAVAQPTKLEEVRALLHTDLPRMPDVAEFIKKHAHDVESLPRVALMNVRTRVMCVTCDVCVVHVISFDVQ